jgi:hypothetical protein
MFVITFRSIVGKNLMIVAMKHKKFGRLKVLRRDMKKRGVSRDARWICKCRCGNIVSVNGCNLRNKFTQSCGCLRAEVVGQRYRAIHGLSSHRLYKIWNTMKERCYWPKHNRYNRYGGRGITVCRRWKHHFLSFYLWALSHGYEPWLSIDRRDNDSRYCPENCRWATRKQQRRNRSDAVR